MTLDEVRVGTRVRVLHGAVQGNFGGLTGMGIHVGEELRVMRRAPFRGPVLVEVPATGARIAVGRGMAERISVEPSDGEPR